MTERGGIVAPHPLKNGLGTLFLADAYYPKEAYYGILHLVPKELKSVAVSK